MRVRKGALPVLEEDQIESKRHGISRLAALTLAAAGGLFLLYALVLALQSTFAGWGLTKTSGEVVRVVTAEQSQRSAPVVKFSDAAGKSHSILMAEAPRATRYTIGDRVDVLYDAREPSQARVTGFTQTFAFPLLLASAGALLLLVAATMSAPPESVLALRGRGDGPRLDPALLQFHPFNAVAVKHYLAEAGAPDSQRRVKITDAAQSLPQGRLPVALAEFLAYAAALAYREDAAQYLATHCPRVGKPAQFVQGGARALAFLFERHAVIALVETETPRPLAQMRQLFARRAGPRDLVPPETVWDATPRDHAPAQAWDALRQEIETWVKDAAPDHAQRDEDTPAVPFLLTGHATGGAMAMLAAYEFAKRGRPVAAVVTFGAPRPGGKAFALEYKDLGLDVRTVSVSSKAAALAPIRWPFAPRALGLSWPLEAIGVADAASVPVQEAPFVARLAHRLLAREEATALGHKRNVFAAAFVRLLSTFTTARMALLRHDIERRYALPLTGLIGQRLNEVLGQEDEATQALSDHLLDIRGVRPAQAHQGFLTLDGLPLPPRPLQA